MTNRSNKSIRSAVEAPAGSAARLPLALLVGASVAAVLSASMLTAVIPVIARDFAISEPSASWVLTGNLLAMAVAVPLSGRAADVFGIRRTYLAGLAAFAAGTLVCATAPNIVGLVLGRIVEGAGQGVILAVASIAVTRLLPAGRRGPALGAIYAGAGVGGSSGPVIGGLAVEVVDWRVLFVALLCAAAILLGLAPGRLPELAVPGERHFDLPGGLLFGLAAGLVLLAVTGIPHAGLGAPTLGTAAAAGLVVVLLVWRLRTAPHPFVRPGLLTQRRFMGVALTAFIADLTNVAVSVLVPFALIDGGGMSPGQVALVLLPGAVAPAVVSPLAGRLSDRVGAKLPVVLGLTMMATAALWLSTVPTPVAPAGAAAGILLLGVGFALARMHRVDELIGGS